jgi:hypothetical protein
MGSDAKPGVEPRVLIDYFLRESLGLTNIVKAIQRAAGIMRAPAGARGG